jgi:hypothetical protein
MESSCAIAGTVPSNEAKNADPSSIESLRRFFIFPPLKFLATDLIAQLNWPPFFAQNMTECNQTKVVFLPFAEFFFIL